MQINDTHTSARKYAWSVKAALCGALSKKFGHPALNLIQRSHNFHLKHLPNQANRYRKKYIKVNLISIRNAHFHTFFTYVKCIRFSVRKRTKMDP